jgi:2-polyprenyl-3-methyl-5-hydroxy-6-metoxy-1,4-benzoquinol methylase
MAYAEITVRDPNPIKRWLQRRRFRDALAILYDADSTKLLKILDFGGGDGELFFSAIAAAPNACVYLHEPNLSLLKGAKEKLSAWEDVYFTSDIGSVDKQSFDYVYCLEVFEHLPLEPTRQAISLIYESLKPGGFAIVGMPHKLFAPALLKGLFRMSRRSLFNRR